MLRSAPTAKPGADIRYTDRRQPANVAGRSRCNRYGVTNERSSQAFRHQQLGVRRKHPFNTRACAPCRRRPTCTGRAETRFEVVDQAIRHRIVTIVFRPSPVAQMNRSQPRPAAAGSADK